MGTDPSQGAAIAQAITETLVDKGARVVVTTHFTRLKAQADADERFQIAAAQFRSGQPTYKLDWGSIGQSYAIDVASRLGLPEIVLDRARSLLNTEERSVVELAAELASRSAELELTQSKLDQALAAAQAKEQEYVQLQHALEQSENKSELQYIESSRNRFGLTTESLQEQIKTLKAEHNIKGLKEAQKKLEALQTSIETTEAQPVESKKPTTVKAGQMVYVPSMRSKGEVLSVSRNRVMVQVNRIKVRLRMDELAELAHRPTAVKLKATKSERPSQPPPLTQQTAFEYASF